MVQCPPMGGLCVKEKQEPAAFWKTFGLAALLWAALAAGSELLFPSSAAAPAGAAGLLRSCLVLPVAEELVFRGAALRLLRPLGRCCLLRCTAVCGPKHTRWGWGCSSAGRQTDREAFCPASCCIS